MLPNQNQARALAHKLGLPFVALANAVVTREVLDEIPAELALENHCLPLGVVGNALRVATATPGDVETIHLIQFLTGKRVQVEMAEAADLERALLLHYGDSVTEATFQQLGADRAEPTEVSHAQISALAEQRPVVRLVGQIIVGALRRRASDIHIRPGEHDVELIYRIDGQLVPIRRFSRALLPALLGRIKIVGGMDITERRVPQDGQARIRDGNNMVDMRLSIIPTIEGESVVIRLLNTGIALKSISELGLSVADLARFTEVLDRSHGMVLVTGPTGSGKSTTLYAVLNTVMKRNVNIITVEEPVEYHIPGIEQVPIRADIGMSFAAALRNILRHDPDVIMVGEIRDRETMQYAIAYAETGHLCLSTLHANNANQTLDRIINFFPDTSRHQLLIDLSLNLKAVISQRLIKDVRGKRVPAVELLLQTSFISDLIEKGAIHEIKDAMKQGVDRGMQTFDEHLYRLYSAGRISLEAALENADSRTDLGLRIRLSRPAGAFVDDDPGGLQLQRTDES